MQIPWDLSTCLHTSQKTLICFHKNLTHHIKLPPFTPILNLRRNKEIIEDISLSPLVYSLLVLQAVCMCKPYSIWFLSPGRQWHDGLTYSTLGQEVGLADLAVNECWGLPQVHNVTYEPSDKPACMGVMSPDVELLPSSLARASHADTIVTDSMHRLTSIVYDLQGGYGPPQLVHLPGVGVCHSRAWGKLHPHGL